MTLKNKELSSLERKKKNQKNKKTIIQLRKLDKVSSKVIPQNPTILDNNKFLKPIIKMDELEILDMEVDFTNRHNPTISIKTLKPNENQINNSTTSTISTTSAKSSNTSNSYIIAIPSYNRSKLIQIKTLALLKKHNIPPERITIFVANQEQYNQYKTEISPQLYGNLVIGVIGLRNQRNFIMNYYPEGKHIVQMDDDLDKIMELTEDKNLRHIANLNEFIEKAFKICEEKGIYLWGVYPLANARFMSPKMTTDLRFIVGPFWGIINRHRQDLQITIDEKENAERTLQHYTIDGAVLRFNNIGIETRYYKNKGGMQNEGKDRKAEALKSVYYLHDKYPKLTKIYLGKKSGVPEIRMRRHPS